MKIVTVVEFCPPRLGSDRRIFELLSRFPETDKINFLVFPPSRALLGLLPFPQEHKKDFEKVIKRGLQAYYVSLPPLLRMMWRHYLLGYCLTTPYVFLRTFRIIRRMNPDIVFLNYPSVYTGLIGLLVSKILRKKVVVDFNDMIADYTASLFHQCSGDVGKTNNILGDAIIRFLTMIQNWIAINADVVVAPSTPIIDHAKQVGIKNIFYLPNGVDTSVFNPRKYHESQGRDLRQKYNVRDNEKLVVYMGRLDEWTGTRLISKCAEKLQNQPVKFLLVGEGQCEPASKTSNVVFSGTIHYDLVPEYLAAADLVLVPMKPDVLGNASSPIKLFEAMAMMKPIVASNTTGISDVAKNYQDGILVPFDENAWAHAILHILKNPSMSSKLGMNGRKKAEAMFDWNILASKLQQLLIQLSKSSHKKSADFQSN